MIEKKFFLKKNEPTARMLIRVTKGFLPPSLLELVKKDFSRIFIGEGKKRTINREGLVAKFNLKNINDYIHLTKKLEGDFGSKIIRTCKELGRKGLIVNIGAAQGYYTVFARLANCSVIAIEPDPNNLQDLNDNLNLNSITEGVRVVPVACGAEDSVATLFTDGSGGKAPNFLERDRFEKGVEVEVKRLDGILGEEIIGENTVLIVDTEGYEEKVLQGIGSLRPENIFIEIHPNFLKKIDSSEKKVNDLLVSFGYVLSAEGKRGDEVMCHYKYKKAV